MVSVDFVTVASLEVPNVTSCMIEDSANMAIYNYIHVVKLRVYNRNLELYEQHATEVLEILLLVGIHELKESITVVHVPNPVHNYCCQLLLCKYTEDIYSKVIKSFKRLLNFRIFSLLRYNSLFTIVNC